MSEASVDHPDAVLTLVSRRPDVEMSLDPYALSIAKATGRGYCLGRGGNADIVLSHGNIARCQLFVRHDARGWHLCDEGSTNEPSHNGEMVPRGERRLLKDGDEIGVSGDVVVFRFSIATRA